MPWPGWSTGAAPKFPVTSMGFSMEDRIELLKLSQAERGRVGARARITDWLSPRFFETEFWYMWCTTFAFQPWHSAVEFRVTCTASCSSFPESKLSRASSEPSTTNTIHWFCRCSPGWRPTASIWSRIAG